MEYPKEIMFKHPGVYCTQITYSPIDNKLFGTERIEDLNVKKSPKQCAFVCGVQFRVVPNAEDPFEEVCSFKIVCFLDWCFFRICKWDKILLSVWIPVRPWHRVCQSNFWRILRLQSTKNLPWKNFVPNCESTNADRDCRRSVVVVNCNGYFGDWFVTFTLQLE